jgi:hypothetical protein
VSAQQARERKKAYLSDLEIRSKELEQRNAELEERVSTLQRENQMLRQVLASICKNGLKKEHTIWYSFLISNTPFLLLSFDDYS